MHADCQRVMTKILSIAAISILCLGYEACLLAFILPYLLSLPTVLWATSYHFMGYGVVTLPP